MSPFECFELYLSLKLHFSTSYSFVQYNGKVKSASKFSFDQRNDKWEFVKLSKHKDPYGFLVANFIDNYRKVPWIGDLNGNTVADQVYKKWKSRNETLTYFVQEEICSHLFVEEKPFKQATDQFVLCALQKKIAPETFIVVDSITKIGSYQDVIDPNVWQLYMRMINKYKELDVEKWKEFKKKFTRKLVDHFKSLKYTT